MLRSFIASGLAAASPMALAGCGGADSTSTTVTVHDTVTSSAFATSSALVPAPAPAPTSAAPEQTWTMPDLRGRNLQDAQDSIQSLTGGAVFFSGSTDLTGQARNQMIDANWQVCTSTPEPGAPFDATTRIDFGVVRIGSETCP